MPRVTVVIPTFNRKEFLEQAVETVRLQTYEPLECVVVDDGSTDGTRDFLDSLDYGALKTVYHEENRGQSVARNAGIEAASGEYVLFLDSDDVLYTHAAGALVEAMESQPDECAGAFASTKLVKSNGRITKRDVPDGTLTKPTFENARAIGGLSCRMFRRNALEDVGGFDESLSRRVDLDLYLKLLKKYTLLGVDEVCCERRIHKGQMSNDRDDVDRSRRKVSEKHQLDDVQYDRRRY